MVEQRTPNPRVGGSSPSCPARRTRRTRHDHGSEQIRPSDVRARRRCSWRSSLSKIDRLGVELLRQAERSVRQRALRWSRPATAALVAYRNEQVFASVVEVTRELEKVTWPTRKETSAATVVVIVTVMISALILSSFRCHFGQHSQAGSLAVSRRGLSDADEVVRGPHLLGPREQGQAVAARPRAPSVADRASSATS